jgi:hypothetical protein
MENLFLRCDRRMEGSRQGELKDSNRRKVPRLQQRIRLVGSHTCTCRSRYRAAGEYCP